VVVEGPTMTRPDREALRRQMLDNIGGWSGALITAVPTAVFVVVNVVTDLRIAVVAAVGAAVLLTGYRLARRQPIQQALFGLLGVVVAALIAARTGQARGYFLLGIWTSFLYAVPFGISVLLRRPLVGLIWEFLDPTPDRTPDATDRAEHAPRTAEFDTRSVQPWHRCRPLLLAYTWATLAATAVFLARGIVQWQLYGANRTGWLAFARIAMGYPLFIAAVGFSFVVVTRARRRVEASG
jgi:hypothetical protein